MGEDIMLDINGNPVTVGAHVMFRGRGTWLRGTVRDVVDDGDSTSDDMRINHLSFMAWVCSKQIRVRVLA